MKKLLLTIMLTLISTNAMAEWTYVAESDSAIIYIDIASKRKVGNKTTVWRLMDLISPEKWDNKDYLSVVLKTEYDCVNEIFVDKNITFYSENMQKGQSLGSFPSSLNSNIKSILPNSLDDFVYRIACGKK